LPQSDTNLASKPAPRTCPCCVHAATTTSTYHNETSRDEIVMLFPGTSCGSAERNCTADTSPFDRCPVW